MTPHVMNVTGRLMTRRRAKKILHSSLPAAQYPTSSGESCVSTGVVDMARHTGRSSIPLSEIYAKQSGT